MTADEQIHFFADDSDGMLVITVKSLLGIKGSISYSMVGNRMLGTMEVCTFPQNEIYARNQPDHTFIG